MDLNSNPVDLDLKTEDSDLMDSTASLLLSYFWDKNVAYNMKTAGPVWMYLYSVSQLVLCFTVTVSLYLSGRGWQHADM